MKIRRRRVRMPCQVHAGEIHDVDLTIIGDPPQRGEVVYDNTSARTGAATDAYRFGWDQTFGPATRN